MHIGFLLMLAWVCLICQYGWLKADWVTANNDIKSRWWEETECLVLFRWIQEHSSYLEAQKKVCFFSFKNWMHNVSIGCHCHHKQGYYLFCSPFPELSSLFTRHWNVFICTSSLQLHQQQRIYKHGDSADCLYHFFVHITGHINPSPSCADFHTALALSFLKRFFWHGYDLWSSSLFLPL